MKNEPDAAASAGAVGQRTCLGCGAKKPKRSMLRLVAVAGVLTPDEKQRLPGRGVYSCRRSSCLSKLAGRQRRVASVLRQELTDCRTVAVLLDSFSDRDGGRARC